MTDNRNKNNASNVNANYRNSVRVDKKSNRPPVITQIFIRDKYHSSRRNLQMISYQERHLILTYDVLFVACHITQKSKAKLYYSFYGIFVNFIMRYILPI